MPSDNDNDNKSKNEKTIEDTIESLKIQNQLLQEQKALATSLSEQIEINRQLRLNELDLAEKQLENAIEQLAILRAIRQTTGKLNKDQKEQEKQHLKAKKDNEEILKIKGEQNAAIEGFSRKLGLVVTEYTRIGTQAETLLGHSFNLVISGAKFSDGLKQAAVGMKNLLKPSNLLRDGLDNIVQQTMEVAKAQDRAVSSFNRLTGTTGEYADIITDAATNNRDFGIGMAEAGDAAGALYTNMSSFSDINKETAKSIVNTTVQLDALGVSADITAKNMEIATQSLGMSAKQAEALQKELYNTSTALGLPAAALSEGFASAAPELAKHGTKMVDVIKGLGKASKSTGLSIDKLVSITAKFDTFQGAADAAGKLNAVLGGDLLNSMDLLMATEEERVKLLQDTINNSGKAWHEMNRFEKQAVANAAGITDMDEAARLFNPRMIGMNKEQKTAAERARAVTTVTKQMEAVFASLAVVVTPLLEGLKWFLDLLIKINKITVFTAGGIKVGLTTAIIGVVAAGYAMIKMFRGLSKLMNKEKDTPKKLGKSLGDGFKKGAKGLSQGISSIGRGIRTFFTAVAQGIATGLTTIAGGVASALGILTGALVSLGVALANPYVAAGLAVFSLTLLAAGAAALMLGAGIGLAALGMSKFVASFKGIDPAALLAFGASMGIIVLAFAALTYSAPAAILAAAALAVSFALLSFSMSSVGESAKAMAEFNKTLIQLNFDPITKGYERVSELIEEIVDNVNNLSGAKGLVFTTMMVASTIGNAVGKTTPNTTGATGVERMTSAAETNAVTKVEIVSVKTDQAQQNVPQNNQVTGEVTLDGQKVGEILIKSKGMNSLTNFVNKQIKLSVKEGSLA